MTIRQDMMIDIHCHRRNKWYLMDMYHIGFLIVFGILDLLWELSYMEDKSHHIHQCIDLDLLLELVHSYMEDKFHHIHQCIDLDLRWKLVHFVLALGFHFLLPM